MRLDSAVLVWKWAFLVVVAVVCSVVVDHSVDNKDIGCRTHHKYRLLSVVVGGSKRTDCTYYFHGVAVVAL